LDLFHLDEFKFTTLDVLEQHFCLPTYTYFSACTPVSRLLWEIWCKKTQCYVKKILHLSLWQEFFTRQKLYLFTCQVNAK